MQIASSVLFDREKLIAPIVPDAPAGENPCDTRGLTTASRKRAVRMIPIWQWVFGNMN